MAEKNPISAVRIGGKVTFDLSTQIELPLSVRVGSSQAIVNYIEEKVQEAVVGDLHRHMDISKMTMTFLRAAEVSQWAM